MSVAPGPERPDLARLGLGRSLQFSAISVPVAALGLAIAVYLPPYFASHLGVSLTVVGSAWLTARLIDIPVDVLLGAAMDRTKSPFGRYRLWFIAGAPLVIGAVWVLFIAPPHSFPMLVVWLLVYYLGTSIVTLPHAAWAAKLAPRYDDRSRLFAILAAVGVLGALAAIGIPILAGPLGLTDATIVPAMGWFVIALWLPATFCVAMIREPIEPDRPGEPFRMSDYLALFMKPDLLRLFLANMALTLGPGWMSAMYLFYFQGPRGFDAGQSSLLLLFYILAGLVGAPLTGRAAMRFGKHRVLMVTTTAYSLGLLSVIVLPPGNVLAAAVPMVLLGAFAAGFDLMIRAMLADVGDEVRLEQGRERISLIYAVNTLAVKIAAAFSIGLSYPLLQQLGYNPAPNAQNTPQALHNLELAYIIGPIVFVMLGGACVIGWRLDSAKHAQIRAELERRDALYTEAPVIETLEGPAPAAPLT